MKKFGIALSVVLSTLCFHPILLQARFYIDINAPALRKIPVAVCDFKDMHGTGNSKLAKSLPQILKDDLVFTGLFKSLAPETFLDNPGLTRDQINFKNWPLIGAELLVTGGFSVNGDTLELKMRFFDTFGASMILGRRYTGNMEDHRIMIHRFTNDIIHHLTGENGIFFTQIAFICDATGHKELYVADFDGCNPHRITDNMSITLSPSWSPNGNKIAYTSFRDGNPDIYVKDLDTGISKKLATYPGLNIAPAWTPSGEFVAATLSKDGNPDIYLLYRNGEIFKKLTNHRGIDVSTTFSPNGKQMAFVSDRSGGRQIYIMDIDVGETKRLTFKGRQNESPTWSPRGDRIAFVGMDGGRFQIYTIKPDGSDLRRLTNLGNNEDPSWSPDGRLLIFNSNRDGKSSIYVMNANGANQRKILSMKGNQMRPRWSPRLEW